MLIMQFLSYTNVNALILFTTTALMATQNNCSYCVLLGQYIYIYIVINFQKCVKIKFTVLILKYLFCLIKIQIQRKTADCMETIIFTECIKEDWKE